MELPTSFAVKDFRWTRRVTGGRMLVYVGFGAPILITMKRLQDGGYSVGHITKPPLEGHKKEAFSKCGGLEGLGQAALWFANSR